MHGNLEVSKLLVQESSISEINQADQCGTTPIMEACRFGYLELIDYLIEYTHADLNRCNMQGLACIHIAAEAGQSEVIKLLTSKYGVDIDMQTDHLNMSPLHWAAKVLFIVNVQYNCMICYELIT